MGIGTNDMSTKQNDETQSRWYMVNKDGMATLCADHADAEQEAKNAQEVWPHMGPHRAVRLVEASQAFTAADMATAAAQGFREGQAAELAAMRAGGEPVAEMVPCHTPSGKRVAVISRFQHLPIGTKLYTHPQPAAQDAEPDMFWDADNREIFAYDIEEIVSEYDPGQIVSIECAQRLPSFRVLVTVDEDGNSYEYLDAAIAAQGDSNE